MASSGPAVAVSLAVVLLGHEGDGEAGARIRGDLHLGAQLVDQRVDELLNIKRM